MYKKINPTQDNKYPITVPDMLYNTFPSHVAALYQRVFDNQMSLERNTTLPPFNRQLPEIVEATVVIPDEVQDCNCKGKKVTDL